MSNLSEEEKKAIEKLKEAQYRMIKPTMLKDVKYTNEDYTEAIDTILNLIEKQQKEIEELKKLKDNIKDNIQVVYRGRSNGKTLKATEFITKEYISKDKIKEKLNKLKEEQKEYKGSQEWEIQDDILAQVMILEELLEEK